MAVYRKAAVLICVVLAGATFACGPRKVVLVSPAPDGVVVAERGRSAGPKSLRVPPGHYPPRGQCRLWYSGRPPGRQPSPVACSRLRGSVARGAFILYNGVAWDTDYNWRERESKKKGSVPGVILDLTVSLNR